MEESPSFAGNTPESFTVPTNPVKSRKPFNTGPYVVGILLFLVICLLGGLTYFILKDNNIDLFSSKTTGTSTTSDNSSSTSTATTCSTNTNTSCDITLTNTDWSLFSLPAYDFSVEVPSYTMTQKIGTDTVPSSWRVGHEIDSTLGTGYDNYLHTVSISFYPSYIPEGTGCDQGCVKEQEFGINIYKNSGNKSLSDVKDAYTQKWMTANKDVFDEGVENFTGDITQQWSRDVFKYSIQTPGGTTNGYLVVTKDYVYEVSYFFSTTPSDSYQIAQKVLDSMKFESAN